MPQGENSKVMVQHQPTGQVISQFLPMPQRVQKRLNNERQQTATARDESREVPLLLMSQVYAQLMSSRGLSLRLVGRLNLEWILTFSRKIPMSISSA